MATGGERPAPGPETTPPVRTKTIADVTDVREMSIEEFVRRLRHDGGADRRFALFLGAGCSVTSGIPAAGRLVTERWLPRLHYLRAPRGTEINPWAAKEIPGY